MRTREATLEDLARVPGKAELVNGRIVRMSPTGGLPGYAGREIVASLHAYSRRTGVGHAIPDNVAFTVTLPHRRSFSPDAAFYVGELRMGFLEGAPRFAVEVRSESDYGPAAERRLARKRDDYFAAGTLVVWDVDLLGADVVRVYRARERPTVSTPITWDEVERCLKKKDPKLLVFEAHQTLDRVGKTGDLFAPLLQLKQKLPKLPGIGEGDAEAVASRFEIAASAEKPRKRAPTSYSTGKRPAKRRV